MQLLRKQPWIGRAWIDIVFILLPPFACLAIIAVCPKLFQNNKNLPDYWWVILILLVDVAHVYSTLYRTYFDKQALHKQRSLLFTIPFVSFVASVMVYSTNSILFWSIMAYIAVFHFIRQQYGFMRIYSRKERVNKWYKRIDAFTIYVATLFPIAYWHLNAPRNFNWFVSGDFFYFKSTTLLTGCYIIYITLLTVYVIKEIIMLVQYKQINIPRVAVIIGTVVSWYFGIVYFNGDMAFTLLNVVSHGIPYMALIWIYGNKNYNKQSKSGNFLRIIFSKYGIAVFLVIIFLLAYIEEGLWDMTVWKEHQNIFKVFRLIDVQISGQLLNFLVPLLALPQITHYVIDGFIWKIKKDDFKWNNETSKLAAEQVV